MNALLVAVALIVQSAEPTASAAAAEAAQAHVEAYKWLHAHPELSNQEKNTAAYLAGKLRQLGVEVHEHIGGHGLVGVLRNSQHPEGPIVLYRADMDALPVNEQTGLPYASTIPDVMHACGHDVHMSTALGVLQVLHSHEETWRGTVLFVGQPAEEVVGGARAMLADPQFRDIVAKVGKPAVSLAWHDAANLPAGDIGLGAGTITANVDSVDVVLHGKGGHGSQPDQTVDAAVMGAEVLMSLQTVVSRRLPPGTRAVLTVGEFTAGSKRNIIASTATLRLTLRSYDAGVRQRLIEEIRGISGHIAEAYHAPSPPDVSVTGEGITGVHNDAATVKHLQALYGAHFGAEHLQRTEPSYVGEDFGLFGEALGCPSVLMQLGAVRRETFASTAPGDLPSLHSGNWAPDPIPTLTTGIAGMVVAIEELTRL